MPQGPTPLQDAQAPAAKITRIVVVSPEQLQGPYGVFSRALALVLQEERGGFRETLVKTGGGLGCSDGVTERTVKSGYRFTGFLDCHTVL